MTKLERLKQEKENINKLLDDVLENKHRGKAIIGLFGTAMGLVDEMIYEQERSIESGVSKKSRKNLQAIIDLAMKSYCKAQKIDPAFRGRNFDPWKMTINATVEEAKAIGIKDKRTVLKILAEPLNQQYIKLEGPHWEDLLAWKTLFQAFIDNKNHRLSESEKKELVGLRFRMEMPLYALAFMFRESEKNRDQGLRSSEESMQELRELQTRLENQ